MAKDITIDGLNAVIRALGRFSPQANTELRYTAGIIATQYMGPAYKNAARSVPIWGEVLANSIRVKKDRLPALSIGYQRKALSGGASSIMLRFPTHSGHGRDSFAPFTDTEWLKRAGPAYKGKAMDAWTEALERLVDRWNRGN